MAKADTYFQFPLCLLALPAATAWQERINTIIGYSVIEFGISKELFEIYQGHPVVVKAKAASVMKALQDGLNFTGGSIDHNIAKWEAGNRVVSVYRGQFPASVGLVRIRTDLCFDSRNGTGLDERQFRILAAIYSAIGIRPCVQVTRDQIIHRSAGCVSRAVFNAWKDKAEPYTAKEVRATTDELAAQSWFRSCVYNRRQKFFSTSLDDAGIRAKVVELKTRGSDATRIKRQQMDAAMTAAILAARQGHSTATQGPNEGQAKAKRRPLR